MSETIARMLQTIIIHTNSNNIFISSFEGNLMDADRVGCYKGRQLGFPGLACKHCVGQAGCGRVSMFIAFYVVLPDLTLTQDIYSIFQYFPASEASLSQTTTSQTIVNHVRNCRRCPIDIREQLEFMKMSKAVTKKVRRSYGDEMIAAKFIVPIS